MGIQFSLLNAVRNLPQAPYNLTDVYADYISDAVLAEELGFKGAFFGERIDMALDAEGAREAEVRLDFAEGRRHAVLPVVRVDEVENLLLAIGERLVHVFI